jgi:DNA-binding CsgD family transcriptional regulator
MLLPKELTYSQAKRRPVVIQADEKNYRATAMSIIERNRSLNRDAFEAVERTRRFIESIGGFEAFERMQRAQELAAKLDEQERYEWAQRPFHEFLQRLNAYSPGFSDFIAIINTEDLNDKETEAAIMRFAGWLGLKLKKPTARQQLKQIAREEGKDYAYLLRWRYLPQAIRDVMLEKQKDEPQRMRLRAGKFIKNRKGKVAEKRPSDLSLIELRLWFRKQVYRRCYELLSSDDALARTTSIKMENCDGTIDYLDIEDFGSEEIAAEEINQDRSLLSFVDSGPLPHLTARENELLRVSEYFSKPTGLTAQEMKMSPATVRVLKHRIVQKTRLLLRS